MKDMSTASPADLAVTFRSIPRRLREAQGDLPAEAINAEVTELQQGLGEAGRLLMTTHDPLAIATAIDATPADDWDGHVLDRLGAIALHIGARLRSIEALRPEAD